MDRASSDSQKSRRRFMTMAASAPAVSSQGVRLTTGTGMETVPETGTVTVTES
ncbi:hypothetical protein ACFQMM_09840 [Saliphagus sp. GCM10025308]